MNAFAIEILSYAQNSNHATIVASRLFSLVLDAAVSLFELQKYSSISKDLSSQTDYPYSSWASYNSIENVGHDASLIVNLYKLLLQSDEEKAFVLLNKIQFQAECISLNEMDRLVFSFLEQTICKVETYYPTYCQFVWSTMTIYLVRMVRKEPKIPKDWSRPNRKILCNRAGCPFCPRLQEFLRDPREESHKWLLDPNPNTQIQLFRKNMRPTEYEIHIDRLENPKVLTITKITEAWEKAHRRWQKRASIAQETFRRLPQPTLKRCLAEKYESIMDLHMLKVLYRDPSDDPPELWDIQRQRLIDDNSGSEHDLDSDYVPSLSSGDEEYESDGDYEHGD